MLGGVGRMRLGRWAVLPAGVAFLAGGIALGAGPYADRLAFDRAPYCTTPPPADPSHCILRIPMTVTARSTYTTEDPDQNWPPPQQPQPPPPEPPLHGPFGMAPPPGATVAHTAAAHVVAMSRTTHYRLTVRTADGRQHRFEVGHDLYAVARPGAAGTAEAWHGRVVRIRIGAHDSEQWPFWRLEIAWMLALTGVILITGRTPPLADAPFGLLFGAWWLGLMLSLVVFAWRPLVWTAPVLIAGAVLLYRVRLAVRWRRLRAGTRTRRRP